MITAIVNTIAMATQFGKFDINSTILSTEFAPKTKIVYMCIYVYVMVKMLVTHFAITVIFAHQILVLVTSIRRRAFSALADWSPKLTMSCTPMHIHSVGYIKGV